MTGYCIEIGYCGDGPDAMKAHAKMLVRIAERLCENPKRLVDEVRRLEPSWPVSNLEEGAALYKKRIDATIIFENNKVRQLASGSGDERELKEALRRAFCRLLIEEMHKRKVEVNLTVS